MQANPNPSNPALLAKPARLRWLGRLTFLGGLFGIAAAISSACYFELSPPQRSCLSCHEIQAPYDRWAVSTHRHVNCKECHGGTFSALKENVLRLVNHVRTRNHDQMGLSEEQVATITVVCGRCHTQEYAEWKFSGHGVSYPAIFLDEKHNATEQIAGDCLRCHGMLFQGNVGDVVEPLDTKGPWHLKQAVLETRPVVPCLACHQVHVAGEPCRPPSRPADPELAAALAIYYADIESRRMRQISASLYSRREKKHIAAVDLPLPVIQDHGRPVRVSPDPRQRVCMQCHAPNAFGQAGSGDDRTPRGVHEGISCVACHQGHGNRTFASCDLCHPQFSHCGLDVRSMDTTFHNASSKHNIHNVQCTDCHTQSIPQKAAGKNGNGKTGH